jgi:hypothetical protein
VTDHPEHGNSSGCINDIAQRYKEIVETEVHYLSVAGHIVAALRAGGSFVLVTGDPPAGAQPLSQALRTATESRHRVIDIPCGPDLKAHELSRAGSAVATLPASGGATAGSETMDPAPPLFVFDDVDRLSEQQIREIFEVTQHAAQQGTAGVLLARPGFLARLEEPSLQFLRTGLAAQLGFQEVGEDEGIEVLRHQHAARHRRNESRGIPPGVFRGLVASGVLLTLSIGAFLVLHYVKLAGEPSAGSASSTPSTREASTPPGAMPASPAAALAPARPAPDPAKQEPALPVATPAPAQAARVPEATPSVALSPPEEEQTRPQATSRAASPPLTQFQAGERPSTAEIAALVTRGDRFLRSGDIASARLFYELAADAGDGSAALRLGATFDPGVLGRVNVRGTASDPAQALAWYRRARDLGKAAAGERLRTLEQQPLTEPKPPAH